MPILSINRFGLSERAEILHLPGVRAMYLLYGHARERAKARVIMGEIVVFGWIVLSGLCFSLAIEALCRGIDA